MQELIDGATAVLAGGGAWSNARRIDRLAGRVDARTVQTVLMILAGREAAAAGGSLPAPAPPPAGSSFVTRAGSLTFMSSDTKVDHRDDARRDDRDDRCLS